MAAGAGVDFIVEIDTGGGTYVQVGGLRSNSFSFAADGIDITSMDSSQWREFLPGKGIRSVSLSASGVLKDTAPIDDLRTAFLTQALTGFRLTEVNGQWTGDFKITSFELAGEYTAEQNYTMSLESSGEVTFT